MDRPDRGAHVPANGGSAPGTGAGGGWVPWAVFAVVAAALVHAPVLRFWFRADDFLHLYQLGNLSVGEFVFTPHGGHLYVLRNALFALLHAAFGTNAEPYMMVTLLHHLLNVALLFAVVRGFFGSASLAGFLALIWGVAPVQRAAIGWYSAHGALLVATLVLWLLLDITRVRRGELTLTGKVTARWALLLAAAALSWGAGVGAAVAWPLVAWLLLPPDEASRRAVRRLVLVAIGMPLLYAGLYWLLPAAEGGSRSAGLQLTLLNPFAWPFTLRLALHLVGYGSATLVLGPFATLGSKAALGQLAAGRGIVSGPLAGVSFHEAVVMWSVFAAACAAVVVWLALRATREGRRDLLGFVLVMILTYGMIAAGRTYYGIMVGSSVASLAATPRYHYIAGIGICLILGWTMLRLAPVQVVRRRWVAAALTLWAVVVTIEGFAVARWVSPPNPAARTEFGEFLAAVDAAAGSAPEGATIHLLNKRYRPALVDAQRLATFPGWAGLYVMSHDEDEVDGHPVRFVEPKDELVERLRGDGKRVASLLMTAKECGACLAR